MPIHGYKAIAIEERYWDAELTATYSEGLASERARWTKIVKELGVTPQ